MRQKILRICTGIVLLIGCWLGSSIAEELKIGYVDIQKAVNECMAGTEAKKEIIKEVETFQRLTIEKRKELHMLRESLDKQIILPKPEARVKKEKEFQNKLRDFQRWGEDTQNEINQKRMELERKIATNLLKVIQKIGTEIKFDLILEKNEAIIPFASKSIDLTDRAIKVYDLQK